MYMALTLFALRSWLLRKFGAGGSPWQLGRLDLSKNELSDDSVGRILERLRELSIKVKVLDLSSNKMATKGERLIYNVNGYLSEYK